MLLVQCNDDREERRVTDAVVFERYGIRIVRGDEGYRVVFDSGEAAGSTLMNQPLTEDQARRAMTSEAEAHRVLLELDDK